MSLWTRLVSARRREHDTEFPCNDCGLAVLDLAEHYMVLDDVWAASGLGPNGGFLCVGCLETRLDRTLTPADFLACPLNATPEWRSPRLADRMGDTTWMLAEIERFYATR
jgi:hypothetical protein